MKRSSPSVSPTTPLDQIRLFPRLRFMGSKYRLLGWLHEVFSELEFESALDAFSGSGSVGYLLKAMGKRVLANDFLEFPHRIAGAVIANSSRHLTKKHLELLLVENTEREDFIQRTFAGIFYREEDLVFLDNLWANLPALPSDAHRALALSAAIRASVKRQPRGVFTVAGDPERYKDGRRDLRLGLRELFLESAEAYNRAVFSGSVRCKARHGDLFDLAGTKVDLVYMDPPYVPRSDDNCYIKRYHFLEGLASYWRAPGTEIVATSKVHKIPKRHTPFSYRRTAVDGFERMFALFPGATLVLSYSTNGYPDLGVLVTLMKHHRGHVEVLERPHTYHFGTHGRVARSRTRVRELLLVGT